MTPGIYIELDRQSRIYTTRLAAWRDQVLNTTSPVQAFSSAQHRPRPSTMAKAIGLMVVDSERSTRRAVIEHLNKMLDAVRSLEEFRIIQPMAQGRFMELTKKLEALEERMLEDDRLKAHRREAEDLRPTVSLPAFNPLKMRPRGPR